jgi:hypothetical protein
VGGFTPFDVVFLAGLLLSVRVMVAGVERQQPSGESVMRTRWAMLSGVLTLSGFLGALGLRFGASRSAVAVAVLLGGAVGALSARLLVARAAAMPVSDHEFDPRYALQGVPAVVVEPIPPFGNGAVQLAEGSIHVTPLRARSVDGSPIGRGVEVGVERIDDGVAVVEAWSAIESRL